MKKVNQIYNSFSTPQKLIFPAIISFFVFSIYFLFTLFNAEKVKTNTIELSHQLLPTYDIIVYNQILLERISFNLNNAVVAKEEIWIDESKILAKEFIRNIQKIDYPNYQDDIQDILTHFEIYENLVFTLSYKLVKSENFPHHLHKQTQDIIEQYNYIVKHLNTLNINTSKTLQDNTTSSYELLHSFIISSIIAFILLFGLFIFFTYMTYNKLKSKINTIVHEFNTIANGRVTFHKRIAYDEKDEFANVISSFNNFIDKLEKKHIEVEITKNDIKNFIADTVHQIGAPITAIGINLELIKTTINLPQNDKTFDSLLKQINASINMLTNSYQDLAYITSNDMIEFQPVVINLSNALDNRIHFFDSLSTVNKRFLECSIDKDIEIYINDTELERLIDNNISNGIKYGKINSSITICLKKLDNNCILEFATVGKEIEDKEKIFEKNYRIDKNTKGLGWGLHMVKNICDKNNITFDVRYEDEQNKFRYTIPLIQN